MSKYAFIGLASILVAAGTAAKAYADGTEDNTPPAGGGEDTPKRGRGRPPAEKPAETVASPAGDTAKDAEEQFQANRALIDPLIKNKQGEDVKKVISKYSKTGLRDLPAASQADFEKDIEALTY